jgi:hypothetical protein
LSPWTDGRTRWVVRTASGAALLLGLGAGMNCPKANAQTCTTQAKMSAEVRTGLSEAALSLAQAVKASDTAKVQAGTVAEYAGGTAFAQTAYLVQSVAGKTATDALRVTQIYELDAQARKVGDGSDADFSCLLAGTASETDFSIAALPPGMYGFAMVEASGDRPWLLSFLMRQDGGVWKMAGFYPRARTAAGHDGVWYWTAAREDAKAKEMWLAWLLYGEADQLLRPANFVTSTNLDKLRAEQRSAMPAELSDGISAQTPLVVEGSDDTEYAFTGMSAEGSEDGKQLNLMLHLRAEAASDPNAVKPGDPGAAKAGDPNALKMRNRAAAKALLDAHKDLRKGFDRVLVFADFDGQAPLVTDETMQEIPL